MRKVFFLAAVLALGWAPPAYAQLFGKNKVQYRVFDWSFIQSPHFDIYFYGGGQSLAEFTSEVAENAYDQISRYLNWDLRRRVSIVLYNSHNDFQQTNVTYSYMPEGVGGVTELFKNRVVIPFEGSYEQFRHVIHHELVHAMINDMVFGGSVQSAMVNRVRLRIPLWMNEGLAEYLSMGWDTEADMIIRDVAVHDRIPDVRELDYYMAYKGGQSLWKFIAEKYGWQKVGEIMGQAKVQQDVEKALRKALGMNFEDLSKAWQKHLKKEYWPDVAGRDELEDFAHRLTDHEKLKNYFNISPAISPDGGKIAVISDRGGFSGIYLISAVDGTEIKKVVKGNRTPDFEELKLLQPGISWSPDGKTIAFAAKAGKSDALYLVNVKSGRKKKLTFELDGIFTAAWSPDGNRIAFVGNKVDASDIYVYDLKKKTLENLTRDVFSDSEPAWSPDGRYIAFVSDRGGKVSGSDPLILARDGIPQSDIYVLDTREGTVEQITSTPYRENYPVWLHTRNALFYTSDRNGVWNLYLHDLDSGESEAVSDVLTGLFQLSLSRDDEKLVFSGYSGVGWDIFSITHPLELPRREVSPSIFVLKGEQKGPGEPEVAAEETASDRLALGGSRDSYSRYIFAPEYQHHNRALLDTLAGKPMEPLATGQYKNADGSYRTHPYRTRFTLDLVSGQVAYSNVFNYYGTTLFAFSDILGDHRIYIGTEMVVNLENSDYFLWYEFLKYRNNYAVSLFHTANFFGSVPEYVVRLRHLSLNFSLSHPFDRFQRLEVALSHNFINQREYQGVSYSEPPEIIGDETLRLLTYRTSWVFDNSSWGFTGPNDGWRANAQFFQSLALFRNRIDFKTLLLDARRYVRLSQLYSLALRVAAGHSFGGNPQKFFLGGTENWILGRGETDGVPDRSRFNNDIRLNTDSSDYLKDLYFSIFVLPVRGSRLVERWGTNVLLTNVEFRFPFVNYLALGFPLKVIFGNIHGVAFADVGMAWDDRLTIVTRTETGEKKFDDLIAGYGLGVRINLGYTILRIDSAWDYTLRGSSKPQYYLSLGTDL
ncbi:MAG: peptidase MA family metallohydrolase [Fidelibacterota bacterium]